MDIEFYEVPGTNRYVCTTETASTSFLERLVGKNDTYVLLDKLNDAIDDADDYHVGVHTAGGTYVANEQFNDVLDDFAKQHGFKRNMDALFTGVWTYAGLAGGLSPFYLGLAAWMAADTYYHHATASEAKAFKENLDDHYGVERDDALQELHNLAHELDVAGTRRELVQKHGEQSLFRKVLPSKEVKAFYDEKNAELSSKFTTLKERAYELAEERGDPNLRVVGDVYTLMAEDKLKGPDFIFALPE
ncbi:MAG: hypothetical protein QF415_13750 [Candidatus Undinarchaeales archaeon]|jgi:hypothetical protein|nr:hypothetical protein [Candidatus Undinarchaeales archaeon]MDP7492628.1 hypothetical protein [Candidatus Undinarchaeales archaeon]